MYSGRLSTKIIGKKMNDNILEIQGIMKEFPGVKALEEVSFCVKRGTVHAVVGENGAGKSTLMKVLSGVYTAGTYSGKILLNGKEQSYSSIKDSENAGIAIIYQELALVKELDVCENLFLGNEIASNGVINWDKAYSQAEEVMKQVGLDIKPATKVINLGVGQQQLVEIAKAIIKDTDILILDEPTAALTEAETEHLLELIRKLRARGVTCLYISHKLNEIFALCDYATVIRDGKSIGTRAVSELTEKSLIAMMVGRELTQMFPRVEHMPQETVLVVKNWSVNDPELPERRVVKDVSFELRKGEILGIAGLMGSGRTELVMSLIGAWGIYKQGEVFLNGRRITITSPKEAIMERIGCVTEDRKNQGLVLGMDINENVSLASHEVVSRRGILDKNKEIVCAESYAKRLSIRCSSIKQKTMNLSGGNQQKVVLAKWLMTRPEVLILDEPTRGIDVGAKVEIYNIMNELIDEGVCIIMISSELPEVLGMSDRILVMHEGRISGELRQEEATQERIMAYATGSRVK